MRLAKANINTRRNNYQLILVSGMIGPLKAWSDLNS